MKKLKSIFPRSFFGRAVLIVVVPILVIQIVLSVVFVQRHYERVTQQMTGSVLDVVNALVAQIDSQPPDTRALDRSGVPRLSAQSVQRDRHRADHLYFCHGVSCPYERGQPWPAPR
jgi:type II secretory pathway component PulM